MKAFYRVLFFLLVTLFLSPTLGHAAPTAAEIMVMAQQQLAAPAVWTSVDGRTELTFPHWVVRPTPPPLFSPAQLETQTLVMPE